MGRNQPLSPLAAAQWEGKEKLHSGTAEGHPHPVCEAACIQGLLFACSLIIWLWGANGS